MTVFEWIEQARLRMEQAGNPDAGWDADFLMCETLGCERGRLRFMRGNLLLQEQEKQANEWLSRRLAGEPLQYVLGYTWFWGLRFACDRRALIPRQDTETLVEAALAGLKKDAQVLDLCCGTGCVGLSIAHSRPDAQVTLSDLSEEALSLAQENARVLGIQARLCRGDLFEAVKGVRFDLIVSNPPYLTGQDMQQLQQEVRMEPEMALFGGEDGLSFYRRMAEQAGEYLLPDGRLMVECGQGQAQDIAALFSPLGEVKIHRDLCGVERVVALTLPMDRE